MLTWFGFRSPYPRYPGIPRVEYYDLGNSAPSAFARPTTAVLPKAMENEMNGPLGILNDKRTLAILVNLAEVSDYDLICLLNDSLATSPGFGGGDDVSWLTLALGSCVDGEVAYFQFYEIPDEEVVFGDKVNFFPGVRDFLDLDARNFVFNEGQQEWQYTGDRFVMVRVIEDQHRV